MSEVQVQTTSPFINKVEAKAIFISVYNDFLIKSVDIAKEVNHRLHEQGAMFPSITLTVKQVREAYEDKLGLKFRNRPRKEKVVVSPKEKVELDLGFDSAPVTTDEVVLDPIVIDPTLPFVTLVNDLKVETSPVTLEDVASDIQHAFANVEVESQLPTWTTPANQTTPRVEPLDDDF